MKKLLLGLVCVAGVVAAVWAASPPWDDAAGHHIPGNCIIGGTLTVGGVLTNTMNPVVTTITATTGTLTTANVGTLTATKIKISGTAYTVALTQVVDVNGATNNVLVLQ